MESNKTENASRNPFSDFTVKGFIGSGWGRSHWIRELRNLWNKYLHGLILYLSPK